MERTNTPVQAARDQANTALMETTNITHRLAEDLSTVMGPAFQAGTLDQQQLANKIAALGPLPSARASDEDKRDYNDSLVELIQSTVKDHTQSAVAEANRLATETVRSSLGRLQKAVEMTVECCHGLKDRPADEFNGCIFTTAKQKAIQTFNDSVYQVDVTLNRIRNAQVWIDGHTMKINDAYDRINNENGGDAEKDKKDNDVIEQSQRSRHNAQEQKDMLHKELVQHFDGTIEVKGKSTSLMNLVIPKDVHLGKGQEVIDNMKAYLRGRASEYFAILPYLHRISDDFDPEQGTFWAPPARRDGGYNQISNLMRQPYAEQASDLYYVIQRQLSPEVLNKILSTYKYGAHEQYEQRCEISDGPSAYFALISLYKPVKAAHRDTLIDTFNTAWMHFTRGDPKNKVTFLRPKLVEAIQLEIPLNWSTTGKKIVQILSRNDHVMAQELKRFERGPTDPRDTKSYLQDLFAAIEAETDNAKLVDTGNNQENQWSANMATNIRRMCKFGTRCTDSLCTRDHPPGHQPTQGSRTERPWTQTHTGNNQSFGWKSNRKGGSKGGKAGKGTRASGGSKGKGRKACEAKGCSHPTPHPSKCLCTTCFKRVIDQGEVMLKDGTTFRLRPKGEDQPQADTGHYGFNAQQIQGLKILKRSANYMSEGMEPGPAAPACVKRARAANAEALRDKRTLDFLSAIDQE